MKRAISFSVARLAAIALLGGIALTGCGGGAETKTNDPTTGPTISSGPTYAGPAPTTEDIQAFRIHFWENVRDTNRCGNCHNAGGQAPNFARSDDVNAAYQQATSVVNRDDPAQSRIVTKVAGGHNCWLTDANSCASILTRWITDWVGASGTSGRQIQLTAPTPKDPGASRRFPATAPAGFTGVHNLLTQYCSNCHTSTSTTKQQPYFASSDIDEAYNAAIPKINLDLPAESRFVIRLGRESHNCWDNCAANAATMQAAIQAMADGIPVTQVDPSLVISKALRLVDGTIASGGNRYEANLVALYEFKTGSGATVFDTSGVEPAADLTLAGQRTVDYDWVGGWGVQFKTPIAKAQAATTSSRKFHQMITQSGEYSIEAWVVPGNVTQEDRVIVSYSASVDARNFTMGQTMYNYDFLNRSSETGTNGDPALSTDPDEEVLQASLQHVVMTYDPVNGRRIYVNGEFTGDLDREGGGTLGDWDNGFAFILGNEVGGNAASETAWNGVLRLVAVHSRALTLEQIQQNFAAGVGEKFFLLFGIEHITSIPSSYILFEATQYDSAGYLFTNPKFVSLDSAARPGSLALRGMRIGVNGAEPAVGQAYRPLDITIEDAGYAPDTGFTLSTVGTVIGLEHGPQQDEFYLCFDQLGSRSNVCSQYASAVPPTFVNTTRPSEIGVRTFDAINATLASITGVSPNNARVASTFANVRQSLPATPDIQAFLSSHQTSIAQISLQYCSVMVDDPAARAAFFTGANFSSNLVSQGDRDAIINPLVTKAIGNAGTQPAAQAVHDELDALIGRLCTSQACGGQRTLDVTKAVCGAALGNAATLVQ